MGIGRARFAGPDCIDQTRTARSVDPLHLRRSIASKVRQLIVNGDLEPEARVTETALASLLHVSRTPLREAFRELESEGLIQKLPHIGTFVAPLSVVEADDIYRVKGLLQVLVVELACTKMTPVERAELRFIADQMKAAVAHRDIDGYAELVDRFHHLLLVGSRSPTLENLFKHLDGRIRRYRRFLVTRPGRELGSLQEHLSIADAVLASSTDGAKEAMHRHAVSAHALITRHIGALARSDTTQPP